MPAQLGPSQNPFTSIKTLPFPSPRTLTMLAERLSGVLASLVICQVAAFGAGQICSITILVADFDRTLRVHLPSYFPVRTTRSWSRSSCVTQVGSETVTGLAALPFMAFSTLVALLG